MKEESLLKKGIIGLRWITAGHIITLVGGPLIGVTLAAILGPHIYGMRAILFTISQMVGFIPQIGMHSALVQAKELDKTIYQSIILLVITASMITGFIVFISSHWIALFFKEPELAPYIKVYSVIIFFSSLTTVFWGHFTRMINFAPKAIIESLELVIYGGVSIPLAIMGYGLFSVVIAHLIRSVLSTILWASTFYKYERWLIPMTFNFHKIRPLLRFGSIFTLKKAINAFQGNIDYVLIGKLLGTEALGFYSLAYQFFRIPLINFNASIQKVLYPIYCQIQNEKNKLRSAFKKMQRSVVGVQAPLYLGAALISPIAIPYFLGSEWIPSVKVMQIMFLWGVIWSIFKCGHGSLVMALGKIELDLYRYIFEMIFLVIGVIIGVRWGIEGVAFGILISTFPVFLAFQLVIVNRLIQLKAREWISNIMPMINLSIFMLLILQLFQWISPLSSPIFQIISTIILGVVIYSVLSYVTYKKYFSEMVSLITSFFKINRSLNNNGLN